MHKEQGDYERVGELKKTILLRFFKNNQKAITDLFLENKILSVNLKQEMLKDTIIEDMERD